MHEHAEYGVAAHWRYKEGTSRDEEFEKRLLYLRRLMDFDDDDIEQNADDFVDAMKSQVFPAMTFALLLVIANFMLGAAAHTRAIPAWIHHATAWATLLVCLFALYREYRVLGENNRLIAEAASRREDSRPVADA